VAKNQIESITKKIKHEFQKSLQSFQSVAKNQIESITKKNQTRISRISKIFTIISICGKKSN
jgi:vacuolar-type H+-ATPase subunit H